jgi:hypothetical protein
LPNFLYDRLFPFGTGSVPHIFRQTANKDRIAMSLPTLRIARPTDNLAAIKAMYMAGLDLPLLGEFKDHDGFDGVMLGQPGATYHLEFTARAGHQVGRAPTEDNLLVYYLPDAEQWRRGCDRMLAAGFVQVASFNPYWDVHGRTFEDVDGYRVVLQNAVWSY